MTFQHEVRQVPSRLYARGMALTVRTYLCPMPLTHADSFCDYKRLKELIKKITEQKLGAESKFLLTLEAEMNKVHGFYQRTLRELRQRLLSSPSDEDLHGSFWKLCSLSPNCASVKMLRCSSCRLANSRLSTKLPSARFSRSTIALRLRCVPHSWRRS